VVINYNQYTDRRQGQVLRTLPEAAALTKRTHELSDRHEIRWYEVADVAGSAGQVEISSDSGAVAAIGIFTVKPGKQDALLAALRSYGEDIEGATGFLGFATHRGHQPEHVASYERWESADVYKTGGDLASRVRDLTDESKLHLYEVVEVARFDLKQVADAPARAPA
jgi:heme-degrading monooxygenase HmoA